MLKFFKTYTRRKLYFNFIIRNNNYKLHTHVHYNYSVQVMRNKKAILEEYCRIKVDIKCVFLFIFNSKTKYTYCFPTSTSQIPTVNHRLYKIHKSTTSDLNIKIVITTVTQYQMQAPFPRLK